MDSQDKQVVLFYAAKLAQNPVFSALFVVQIYEVFKRISSLFG